MMRSSLRIDVKMPPQHVAWPMLRDAVVEADRSAAFTGAWFFDHLDSVGTGPSTSDRPGPCFEGWSLLAGLATMTERLRLGLMVTAVPYRPVGLLARIVGTVDTMSGGRVDLGLGAGNSPDEAAAFGIDIGSPGRRLDRLSEACVALRLLLRTTDPVDFHGEHVTLRGARCDPGPVQAHVPFFVGGKGERRTLPLVARLADGWNYSNGTPEEFGQKLEVLRALSSAAGRHPDDVLPSVQIRVSSGGEAEAAELAERYIAAGARHILLYAPADPALIDPLAGLADQLRNIEVR